MTNSHSVKKFTLVILILSSLLLKVLVLMSDNGQTNAASDCHTAIIE